MGTSRIEAFSDGVIAILITIMVLELPKPDGASFGRDLKGKLSVPLSAVAILLTLVSPYLGLAVHVIVAVLWFVPDRRVERQLEMQHPSPLPEELER